MSFMFKRIIWNFICLFSVCKFLWVLLVCSLRSFFSTIYLRGVDRFPHNFTLITVCHPEELHGANFLGSIHPLNNIGFCNQNVQSPSDLTNWGRATFKFDRTKACRLQIWWSESVTPSNLTRLRRATFKFYSTFWQRMRTFWKIIRAFCSEFALFW